MLTSCHIVHFGSQFVTIFSLYNLQLLNLHLYPRSGMDAFGRWASTYNWFGELEPNPTTDCLAFSFTNRLTETVDRIFPQKR